MKIRKAGTMEHPDLGSKVARVKDDQPEGSNRVLYRFQSFQMEATDKMLARPQTVLAARDALPHARRAVPHALALNPQLKTVKFKMLDEWPHANPHIGVIGMCPMEQRYHARHTVWHETGHIAHSDVHEFRHLMKSAFRPVFMAWRRDTRKSAIFATRVPYTRGFIRYLTNAKDERLSLKNRRLPALWRKASHLMHGERVLSPIRLKQCDPYLKGWDEFLAESFRLTHMPGRLPLARFDATQTALEKYFPRALKAYRKAVVDDRRIKRRERSDRVLARTAEDAKASVHSLATEADLISEGVEPDSKAWMRRTENLCPMEHVFDREALLDAA